MKLLGTVRARDKAFDSKYDKYVEHPRYGRRPHYTGLNPDPYDILHVHLHSNATNIHELQKIHVHLFGKRDGLLKGLEAITPEELRRIAGTAILANPSKQNRPTVPVTHYYDIECVCRNCRRQFIFFAEEQKHWYEELGFRLEVDCVLCPPCRKREQSLAAKRATYERLLKSKTRDWRKNLQMVNYAVTLVEAGVFKARVVERMRAAIKTVPVEERDKPSYRKLVARMKEISGQTKK